MPGISQRTCFALPGPDLAHRCCQGACSATGADEREGERGSKRVRTLLSCYLSAMRCPVLTPAMLLPG
eukprot:3528764-Rhodomonas_salina.1